jgi:hypothetical protein
LIHTAITAGTSRVAHGPLCLHAVANTPAGLMELVRSYCSTNFGLPSKPGRVGSCISLFEACSAFTHVTACTPSRLATLCTRGFSSFVASTAALIATGWSEPVPGRVYPRCGPAPCHGAPGNPTYQACGIGSLEGFFRVARGSGRILALRVCYAINTM